VVRIIRGKVNKSQIHNAYVLHVLTKMSHDVARIIRGKEQRQTPSIVVEAISDNNLLLFGLYRILTEAIRLIEQFCPAIPHPFVISGKRAKTKHRLL
jgi:hypothetical protein